MKNMQNRNLLIISFIILVNMLGYGIIIPILYSYSKKFGLSDFQNGLLFAMFSICQFFATPLIGRLSDKYGRRPMLLVSISGTVVSFFLMALAPNAFFLFLARAVDGITAGNIPVAYAVISDTTKPEDRARAFGFLGSAFNFGFIFGPAIAAVTIGFGTAVPFYVAGIVTLIAAILTALFLPETNKHMGEVTHGKLFDFPLLWRTLFDPVLGSTFLMSFIYFLAFSCAIIYGFQPFVIKVLRISEAQNAILFTVFGTVGLISQSFLVAFFTKLLGMKKAFSHSIALTAISFLIMYFAHSAPVFIAAMLILAVSNSLVQTLIPTLISQDTDAKSQGSMMGLNTSYQSIGMIVGPIIGGAIATVAVPLPFLLGGVFVIACYALSFQSLRKPKHKETAFIG